jgi:hypothetical protein
VNNAATGGDGSPQALLDGFQAAIVVSVIAAGLGVVATAVRRGPRTTPAAELDGLETESQAEAA